jgi:hypothetical protein
VVYRTCAVGCCVKEKGCGSLRLFDVVVWRTVVVGCEPSCVCVIRRSSVYCGVSRSAREEQLEFRGKFIVYWENFWVVFFVQYSILI